ncbi:MotA/TolQ/ExbB proton channel family protein [Thermoproteota archaeon]
MLDFIYKGGVIQVLLVLAYFYVLIIGVERLIYFFSIRGSFTKFISSAQQIFSSFRNESSRLDSAKQLSSSSNESNPPDSAKQQSNQPTDLLEHPNLVRFQYSPFYLLTSTYLKALNRPEKEHGERLIQCGDGIISKMEVQLWILSLIGHVAPLLGLLGTMTGLIRSFKAIEAVGGAADVTMLAGGIWEAMLTTVMGLIVAIIAFSLHKIISRHIEKKSSQMTHLIRELNIIFSHGISKT